MAQLLNECYSALKAYRPSTNGANYFRIESFNIPNGGASVVQKLASYNRDLLTVFGDTLIDAGEVTPRADGIYGFCARMQSTNSMFKRLGVSTSSVASYIDFSASPVDNNIKFTALLSLYK